MHRTPTPARHKAAHMKHDGSDGFHGTRNDGPAYEVADGDWHGAVGVYGNAGGVYHGAHPDLRLERRNWQAWIKQIAGQS